MKLIKFFQIQKRKHVMINMELLILMADLEAQVEDLAVHSQSRAIRQARLMQDTFDFF